MFIFLNFKKILLTMLLIFFLILLYHYLVSNTIPSYVTNIKFKVVIDAGHGSIDTGTSYQDIYEKDINLMIAKLLYKELKKVNIIPIMTREEDILYLNSRSKDICRRPKIAEENKADLFISIHVNNFPTSQPSGSQLFYKSGSSLSKDLAECIQIELINLRKENNRTIKKGDFYVLNHATCPAILIEVGFLSNPEDRRLLIEQSYQGKIAVAIKNGIVNYFYSQLGKKKMPDMQTKTYPNLTQLSENYLYYLTYNDQNIFLIKQSLSYSANNIIKKENSPQIKEAIAFSAINQLMNPSNGLLSPIPAGSKILFLEIINKKAILNFSKEIKNNFKGGAQLEYCSLQAIYYTLFSIPGIEEVEILIEGKSGDSIGGHIILNPIKKFAL